MTQLNCYIPHPTGTRHFVRDNIFKPLLEAGINAMNPFYSQEMEPRSDVAAIDNGEVMEYQELTIELSQQLVRQDERMIEKSDFIIAYMPYPSWGSGMEIYYASKVLRLPVIIITEDKWKNHPWLQSYAYRIFFDAETALSFILNIEPDFVKGLKGL